jgi:hypothetical protein
MNVIRLCTQGLCTQLKHRYRTRGKHALIKSACYICLSSSVQGEDGCSCNQALSVSQAGAGRFRELGNDGEQQWTHSQHGVWYLMYNQSRIALLYWRLPHQE